MINVDTYRCIVVASGKELNLAPLERDILFVLAEADGYVIGREQFGAKIWPREKLCKRTVDQHVARLRRKLGRDHAAVVTVNGRGYRADMSLIKMFRRREIAARVDTSTGKRLTLTLAEPTVFVRGATLRIAA